MNNIHTISHPDIKWIERLARRVGKFVLDESRHFSRSDVKEKGGFFDLVTSVDLESDKKIVRAIKRKFPTHTILSEEQGIINPGSAHKWYIDPIDGTTNFIHQWPFYAVSIGYEYKRKLHAGAIYAPALNEMYIAELGQGAYLNGERMSVSTIKTFKSSLLATGHACYRYSKNSIHSKLEKSFIGQTQGIRRLGAATLDFAYVARGAIDGFFEMHLQPWDIAAGALLVTEAGGRVTTFNLKKNILTQRNILASNGHMHKKLYNAITETKYETFVRKLLASQHGIHY